ncbi:hypothetical protein EUTSA_v10019505mg [Eutrema salsugineum]|uniref:CCHC-type domain-containing protein n=1 Tax=Eutrema salsugineum TaxID=72664 RepID=V4JRB8_EUTSA|nr:hypothetical protein EUTSA_v10019505mg [Eutrema salsugineum]
MTKEGKSQPKEKNDTPNLKVSCCVNQQKYDRVDVGDSKFSSSRSKVILSRKEILSQKERDPFKGIRSRITFPQEKAKANNKGCKNCGEEDHEAKSCFARPK